MKPATQEPIGTIYEVIRGSNAPALNTHFLNLINVMVPGSDKILNKYKSLMWFRFVLYTVCCLSKAGLSIVTQWEYLYKYDI